MCWKTPGDEPINLFAWGMKLPPGSEWILREDSIAGILKSFQNWGRMSEACGVVYSNLNQPPWSCTASVFARGTIIKSKQKAKGAISEKSFYYYEFISTKDMSTYRFMNVISILYTHLYKILIVVIFLIVVNFYSKHWFYFSIK